MADDPKTHISTYVRPSVERAYQCDEELRSISILACIRHAHASRTVMLQSEVLVWKGLGAVDADLAGTIAMEEITTWEGS